MTSGVRMLAQSWAAGVPLIGIAVMVSLPFAWHIGGRNDEQAAIRIISRIHEAQERYRSVVGGYALELDSLLAGCPGTSSSALATLQDDVRDAGYTLMLRAAEGSTPAGNDCQGRPTASEYYLAAAPVASATSARQAYASVSNGPIYVFFDGVPPRERDIAAGLPVPLDTLEEFRIP